LDDFFKAMNPVDRKLAQSRVGLRRPAGAVGHAGVPLNGNSWVQRSTGSLGQKRVLLTGWCVAGRRAASVNARVSNGSAPTIGRIECAATAADSENCLAKLVRREGDALNSLLRRFDKAIEEVLAGGDPIDEINDLSSRSQA